MDLAGAQWGILNIIGPLLLAGTILWAALSNRSSRATRDESEIATRELYEEEDRAHRGEGDNVP